MRDFIQAVSILSVVVVAGCASPVSTSPPMAAAAGVARADGGKGPREHRIIPLKSMTGDVEILYGDPEVPGESFVMRIRELPGGIVPPHSHPVDENITVVEGTWYFALGEEYKPEALQELKAGTYAFAPKGSTMFGYSPAGAVVQVHGVGPFRIHWREGLHTLDDADAKSVFRFTRGARVASPGRSGSVAEGYASGKIVQYEIEAANGERFMASEHDLQLTQSDPDPPSSSASQQRDGQHDFDFEFGTWKTHLKRLLRPLTGSTTWVEYEGTTTVGKIWGGRANLVELVADGPAGHFEGLNLRLYDPQSRQWSLNFSGLGSGSMGAPAIGRFKEGRGEFFNHETFNGRDILVRFVISDITPDSCRFEQSFSDDGGKTWEVNWIAVDTRT